MVDQRLAQSVIIIIEAEAVPIPLPFEQRAL